MEKLDHNKVIVRTALELIEAHRASGNQDAIYGNKLERADYILDTLQDKVVDFIYALLDADNHGEMLCYPMPAQNEPNPAAKKYYSELDNTLKKLSHEVTRAKKQAEFNRVADDFKQWTKQFIGE